MTGSVSRLDGLVRAVTGHVPEGASRETVRGMLFRTFGAPRWHPKLQLPRKDLFIDPGDSVVMVGTPNTHRVAQLAELVGKNGRVLIIEPVPDNYTRLDEAAADYDNVSVDPRGAWNTTTTKAVTVVHDNKDRPQAATTPRDKDASKATGTVEVDLAPLDTILAENDVEAPDYLEVMVNGAEVTVIKGAADVLSTARPRWLIKSYGYNTDDEGDDSEIFSILRQGGYNFVRAPSRDNPPSLGSPDGDIFAWARGRSNGD